jgi:hypothetical protein
VDTKLISIYGDESCHLENDHQAAMVLGAVWCPTLESKRIFREIRQIKEDFGLHKTSEIKWTKISLPKLDAYLKLIDYFFETPELQFRAVIVPDKSILHHEQFNQTHDEWFHKMYYTLISRIVENNKDSRFRIFLDIKDTNSGWKFNDLKDILNRQFSDITYIPVEHVQAVRSKEVELVQLADLLIGAVGYANRNLTTSQAKITVINRITSYTNHCLTTTTYTGTKFDLFKWVGR